MSCPPARESRASVKTPARVFARSSRLSSPRSSPLSGTSSSGRRRPNRDRIMWDRKPRTRRAPAAASRTTCRKASTGRPAPDVCLDRLRQTALVLPAVLRDLDGDGGGLLRAHTFRPSFVLFLAAVVGLAHV